MNRDYIARMVLAVLGKVVDIEESDRITCAMFVKSHSSSYSHNHLHFIEQVTLYRQIFQPWTHPSDQSSSQVPGNPIKITFV